MGERAPAPSQTKGLKSSTELQQVWATRLDKQKDNVVTFEKFLAILYFWYWQMASFEGLFKALPS